MGGIGRNSSKFGPILSILCPARADTSEQLQTLSEAERAQALRWPCAVELDSKLSMVFADVFCLFNIV